MGKIDELVNQGFGNQSDVIRTALDRMHQKEIDMNKKYRRFLDQKFSDLGIGELDELDRLTDDELESLIDQVESLLEKYPEGVESNAFMDELPNIVEPLIYKYAD